MYLRKISYDFSCQIWTGHRNIDWQVWSSTLPIVYPDLGTWGNRIWDNAYDIYKNIFTYNSINYVKQYYWQIIVLLTITKQTSKFYL